MVSPRDSHVWRQTKEGDEDVWVDVARVDRFVAYRGDQKITYNLKWDDESAPLDHPTRTVTVVNVTNPDEEEQIIELHDVRRAQMYHGDQKKTHLFLRGEIETEIFSYRRIYHYDTPTNPEDYVKLDLVDYSRESGTEDQNQYVDVKLIEQITTVRGQGQDFQREFYRFNVDPIKEFSVPSPPDLDLSKVVHLSPLQNIINVQWGGDNVAVTASGADFWISNYRNGVWTPRGSRGLGDFSTGDPFPGQSQAAAFSKVGRFFLVGGSAGEPPLPQYEEIIMISRDGGMTWNGSLNRNDLPTGVLQGFTACSYLEYDTATERVWALVVSRDVFTAEFTYIFASTRDGSSWRYETGWKIAPPQFDYYPRQVHSGTLSGDKVYARALALQNSGNDQAFKVTTEIELSSFVNGPWRRVDTGADTAPFATIGVFQIAMGKGALVACGNRVLMSTRDGRTWTKTLDLSGEAVQSGTSGVVFVDGQFIASGGTPAQAQRLYYSNDGFSWRSREEGGQIWPRQLASGRI